MVGGGGAPPLTSSASENALGLQEAMLGPSGRGPSGGAWARPVLIQCLDPAAKSQVVSACQRWSPAKP